MNQPHVRSSFDGVSLNIRWNTIDQPKATLVIAHGLAEHLGRYDEFAAKLNEWGYNVLRYDQRGHGHSEGERGYLASYSHLFLDCNEIVEAAKEAFPDLPVLLFGHSMGGYTATGYAILYPRHVKGIVFSGPLTLDTAGILRSIDLSLDPHIQTPNALADAICSDRKVVEDYQNDPLTLKSIALGLMQEIARSVPWIDAHLNEVVDPILVLHGEKDALVNVKDSEELYLRSASTDKTRNVFDGLWHEILNEQRREEVYHVIHEWLDRHC
ncbi:MAG: lysophospholipase [Erysipelotrichaceae bacterium]|nr:lysophospholipase [Erysipelotrichaceae bacterium]